MSKKPKRTKPKLPPDPEGRNDERAEWAAWALDAFMSQTLQKDGERHEALVDLVCNLLHLADREGLDPAQVLRMASGHYEAETDEEAE